MKAPRGLWLATAGLLFLGIAVAGLWLFSTGGLEVLASLRTVAPLPFAGALAVTAACIGVRFLRWRFLLRRADVRVPARSDLLAYLASLVGRATPAYVGEALRCIFLRRWHGVSARASFSILVTERSLDLAALGLLLALSAHAETRWLTIGLVCAGAGLLFALVAWSVALRLARPARPSRDFARPGSLWIALAASVAAWAPTALCLMFAARAAGAGSLDLPTSLGIFCKATLGGAATLMPVGVGATGSIAILELGRLTDPAAAILVVTVFRLATTGFSMAVGAVALITALAPRRAREPHAAEPHFDAIAGEYADYVEGHVWRLLIDRRIERMQSDLPEPPESGLGLDLGCGLGAYCRALGERGYRVVGLDGSAGLLRGAAGAGARVLQGDALHLPFPDRTFDFVFTIGVLHHLPGEAAQTAAAAEIARVLKPGGALIVHETNTRNPLFRFYMGYVFPVLKSVDEGTEWWIPPDRWQSVPSLTHVRTEYFTFLPDFAPGALLPLLQAVENRLERSPLAPLAVHYMAVLRRPDAGA